MDAFDAGDAVHPAESRVLKLPGSSPRFGVPASSSEKGGDGEASLLGGLLHGGQRDGRSGGLKVPVRTHDPAAAAAQVAVLLQAHLSRGQRGVGQWGARVRQPVPHTRREVWERDGAGSGGEVMDGGRGGWSRVGGEGPRGPIRI